MAQHVLEGQVGVFLAALYKLICTHQQGITSMVVAQAGLLVHLGVNNWTTTASMTRLFAQVIPGLGSLHRCTAVLEQIKYTPIPPKGFTMVPTLSFPGQQVGVEGTATRAIYLENETDSEISSVGRSTKVKTLAWGSGDHCQPLTSTPKPKPKLLVVAQQHRDELAAKQRGAPHGAHVQPMVQQVARTRPPGLEPHSQKQNANPGRTRNSSFVSVEEYSEFTMATWMRRDAPHRIDLDEDIVSIRDSSDIEMVSPHEYDRETKDSLPNSDAEGSHHPSDGSDMESNQDQGSGHHSDSNSKQGSGPGSTQGSDADSGSDNGGDPESSDDNGVDFSDLFMAKKECPGSSKRPQSWPSSNSRSRSQETENQKRQHVPSPENDPNSDKPDRKEKKSDWKETPPKTTSKKESAQEKLTWQVGEEIVHKFREEEENRERESRPKKHKKKESSHLKETLGGWNSSEEDERRSWKKKEKDAKAQEAREVECPAEEQKKEKAEDMGLAWGKLINKERREKYSLECPELIQYHQKNISERQRGSINLDHHTTYLREAWKDKSLCPHNNVMSRVDCIVGKVWSDRESRQSPGSY